ncbi:FUSC family protein [Granulicella cerasi]|uniref:FUSC family protein n=1 Tax=Granulicella cerasi TaxID=741063 RepID=A0ABW1ZBQ2_9BACT|nr:FUSC family protein [Granulicella cerasi]
MFPRPERLSYSLRVALASVVALVIMMVLQAPFASYAVYVILTLGFKSPTQMLRIGFALMIAIVVTLGSVLLTVILTDNDPMVRVLSLMVVVFVAAMISVATSIPAIGSGIGQVFFLGISFWDNHVPADRLVKNTMWLVGTFGIAIGTSIAVEYIFASRTAAQRLSELIRTRYIALADCFDAIAKNDSIEHRAETAVQVSLLATQGNAEMLELYREMSKHHATSAEFSVSPLRHVLALLDLLEHAAAFAFDSEQQSDEIREQCSSLAHRFSAFANDLSIRKHETLNESETFGHPIEHLREVETLLRAVQSNEVQGEVPSQASVPNAKTPLILPGELTKPENVFFAMKISLCATLCFIAYHAINWPGINTAVITVIVTGLGQTGAMKQKLTFRLIGGVIGGLLLGMGAVILLFPLTDSITSLVILVGLVSFISAWGSAGERFSYIGLQVAFAFYVTTLGGFVAPAQLNPARDRLAGILLATFVMWFVMDQIWPVRTVTVMRQVLASILRDAAQIVTLVDAPGDAPAIEAESTNLQTQLRVKIGSLRSLQDATLYEFGPGHRAMVSTGNTILSFATELIGLLWDQAVLLHEDALSDLGKDPASMRLRSVIAHQLLDLAFEMENVLTGSKTTPRNSEATQEVAGLPSNQYVHNTLARYSEVKHWASVLKSESH